MSDKSPSKGSPTKKSPTTADNTDDQKKPSSSRTSPEAEDKSPQLAVRPKVQKRRERSPAGAQEVDPPTSAVIGEDQQASGFHSSRSHESSPKGDLFRSPAAADKKMDQKGSSPSKTSSEAWAETGARPKTKMAGRSSTGSQQEESSALDEPCADRESLIQLAGVISRVLQQREEDVPTHEEGPQQEAPFNALYIHHDPNLLTRSEVEQAAQYFYGHYSPRSSEVHPNAINSLRKTSAPSVSKAARFAATIALHPILHRSPADGEPAVDERAQGSCRRKSDQTTSPPKRRRSGARKSLDGTNRSSGQSPSKETFKDRVTIKVRSIQERLTRKTADSSPLSVAPQLEAQGSKSSPSPEALSRPPSAARTSPSARRSSSRLVAAKALSSSTTSPPSDESLDSGDLSSLRTVTPLPRSLSITPDPVAEPEPVAVTEAEAATEPEAAPCSHNEPPWIADLRIRYRRLLAQIDSTVQSMKVNLRNMEQSMMRRAAHPRSDFEHFICMYGLNVWLVIRDGQRMDYWFYCGTRRSNLDPVAERIEAPQPIPLLESPSAGPSAPTDRPSTSGTEGREDFSTSSSSGLTMLSALKDRIVKLTKHHLVALEPRDRPSVEDHEESAAKVEEGKKADEADPGDPESKPEPEEAAGGSRDYPGAGEKTGRDPGAGGKPGRDPGAGGGSRKDPPAGGGTERVI